MPDDDEGHCVPSAGASIAQLRADAAELGIEVPADAGRDLLERSVRERVDFINSSNRGSVLDLATWAGISVAGNPANETVIRRVLEVDSNRLDLLSLRGLRLLAALRGLNVADDAPREELEVQLRSPGRFWNKVRRRRRKILGSILGRAFDTGSNSSEGDPATPSGESDTATLKKRIEDQGVVGGIADTLRGVADDYVAKQLDEIERRIDAKLDAIDERLSEWRDQEVSNRLKILKLTLVFSILVAVVSLGYDWLQSRVRPDSQAPNVVRQLDE